MNVLAGLFDLADNGFDIGDAGALVAFIAGVIALVTLALNRFTERVRHIVRDEIALATAPIQKGANGGLSLPDVARSSDWTMQAVKAIARAQGVDLPPEPVIHKGESA
jgi:hypothetical protein